MKNEFRSWSDVRIFLAVVREGSTLAASKVLGLAQPTVARRIDALEHETGLTLFVRDTRGFKPTKDAMAILPIAEAFEDAAGALSRKVQDLSQPRPIRITGFDTNFSERVSQIFNEFCALHPKIQIEFLPSMQTLDLVAGEADIALRLSRSPQDPDLICRTISLARYSVYGTPDYAAKHGLPTKPEELAEHAVFSFKRSDIRPTLHDWLTHYVPEDKLARIYSETSLMYAAVYAGQGLGLLNLRLIAAKEKAGAVIRCFEPPAALNAEHMVLIAPDAYRRAEVKAFAKYFIPRYAALFKD